MSIPTKPKIKRICLECRKDVFVRPYKVHTFKFCSNICKFANHRKKIPHNKMQPNQYIWRKCKVVSCTKGRWILPCYARLGRYKFCSKGCHIYFNSKRYQLDLELLKQKKEQETRRNIWFIR